MGNGRGMDHLVNHLKMVIHVNKQQNGPLPRSPDTVCLKATLQTIITVHDEAN